MKAINFKEYQKILKLPFFQEEEWDELNNYREILEFFCKKKKYDIEEAPKKVSEDELFLGGFIGEYQFKTGKILKIEPNPSKLKMKEFFILIKEIANWAGMFGSLFLKNVLDLCSPIDSKIEIVLTYSDLLIKFTENAISEYIPPIIEKKRYSALIPFGKILIPQTISKFSKGQLSIVFERINVNKLSKLRLFLIKFHIDISQELKKLEKSLKSKISSLGNPNYSIQLIRILSQNLKYHNNYILSDFNRNLLESVYESDFTSLEVLQELWMSSSISPSFRDIILLWEAYIQKRGLFPKFKNLFTAGYTLKPLSKLYEIWCLTIVLDVLKDLFQSYESPKKLPGCFKFLSKWNDWQAELHYNKSITQESKLIKKLRDEGFGVSPRKKPDIAIIFSKESKKVILVLEVKYRLPFTIKNKDLERFFWYLMDLSNMNLSGKVDGVILHIPSHETYYNLIEREYPNIAIHSIGLKPNHESSPKKRLKDIFSQILGIKRG